MQTYTFDLYANTTHSLSLSLTLFLHHESYSFPPSLFISLPHLFYIPCISLPSLSLSLRLTSCQQLPEIYCFSAVRPLIFLRVTLFCCPLLGFGLSLTLFPPSLFLHTFPLFPCAVPSSAPSFSLIPPLHSTITFICSFIASPPPRCLFNSPSIAPSAGLQFSRFYLLSFASNCFITSKHNFSTFSFTSSHVFCTLRLIRRRTNQQYAPPHRLERAVCRLS